MKNGLIFENGELIYYKNDKPYHAGAIKVDGDIYYIRSGGKAVKGRYAVHREMTNGLLRRGNYKFGEDYKLIKDSYIPRKKRNKELLKKPCVRMSLFTLLILLALGIYLTIPSEPTTTTPSTNSSPSPSSSSSSSEETTQPAAHIVLPTFKEALLCSDAALRLYNGEITTQQAVEAGEPYCPLTFDYILTGETATLYISEKEDFIDADAYEMPENQSRVLIDNLKTGTKYYWKVVANGQTTFGEFETLPSTRFVYMNGAGNTRDIGGYVTQDGKTVKQGLIIRGSEIDGLADRHYFIHTESIPEVQDTFGFVYDFDLRKESTYYGEYKSRLGDGVEHKFYGAPQYGQMFTKEYRESLRAIFADLADPEKYPMYLHCTYGADRTGTIVFLLQGILNMSEEDMIREHQRTGFDRKYYSNANSMDIIIEGLRLYEGDTLQARIVTFLKTEVGVTQEQIDSIRNILLSE